MSTLDEITKEKQRISEALARVAMQREKLAGQLGELEATERVLARYTKGTRLKQTAYDDPTTYTGDSTPLAQTRSYEWWPPLSDIIGGLLESGLRLDFLHEHETLPWRHFPMMVPAGSERIQAPG